ncbi:MAG TPA: monofunctional biosynthetic peptidoglycan transglycosylase [Caulobacteraceae bacterium]|nr:monofunctional biosynthetic peptidoglycan transglycosylase [Caulobacteraceae bacterium]
MAKNPVKTAAAPRPRGRGLWRAVRNLLGAVFLALLVGPPLAVIVYRFVPPPLTILMVERLVQGHGLDHRWRPLGQISPAMPRAVVASEDARFCYHHGFDFRAIEKAIARNEKRPGRPVHGGSTVSQQTAKNVFLWPERTWVRKGAEAYFTVLIEALWGKRRIMEVYLNTVEFGPGIYGVEAASQRYFHHPASKLTPTEAARLAAILPNPLKYKAVDPGAYVRRRTGRIGAASGTVQRLGADDCVED